MDTALITFMTQTPPSTKSVHLIGSWDNFQKHYPMERDIKRSRGQWKGCYSFENIIYDGEGRSHAKRTGGLKMGSTYYYYYELDHGTEHYDASIPFTTLCPYLPGQPVNLLYVPIEVQPLRFRSASMTSLANGDMKTMNPADKFVSPRQPPSAPSLARLNTAPMPYPPKRTARSLSPRVDKQWSPRNFFGLRVPSSSSKDRESRGRSSSLNKMSETDANGSIRSLSSRREDGSRTRSPAASRSPSPPSIKRSRSQDPSPLRQIVTPQSAGYTTTTFTVPDEIAEEIEDDENFACEHHRGSIHEKGLHTQLSPPPSARPTPLTRSLTDTSKPLPQLPPLEEDTRSLNDIGPISSNTNTSSVLIPEPLRIRSPLATNEPRSHFSVSTIATSIGSPSSSSFFFSEGDDDENDYEDISADLELDEECTYSPVIESSPVLDSKPGFAGYSLPEADYGSEHTLKKQSPMSPLSATSTRTTFGAAAFAPIASVPGNEEMSALEQLMSEMGYLGDVIINK